MAAVPAPLELGFQPDDDHDIAVGGGDSSGEHLCRGPGDGATAVLVEVDERTGRAEIEIALGVDRRQGGRVEAIGEVAGRGGGCVAGVVPAFERCDDDLLAELGKRSMPVEVVVAEVEEFLRDVD